MSTWTAQPVQYTNRFQHKGVGPDFKDGSHLDGCTSNNDCLVGSFCGYSCQTYAPGDNCGRYLHTISGTKGRFCIANEFLNPVNQRAWKKHDKMTWGIARHNKNTGAPSGSQRALSLGTQSVFFKSGRMLHPSGMDWNILKLQTPT